MLNLQNLDSAKLKLINYDPLAFDNSDNSFRFFLNEIKVNNFRHISGLQISFDHPITVLTGTNKIGKTSALLLIACSHYAFNRYDATTPGTVLRRHTWRDVLTFTHYESSASDYSYELAWRVGTSNRTGEGKRLANSQAWTGLGKSSSDNSRVNAQIRNREVRLIDLERLLPARNFSSSLRRKIDATTGTRVSEDVEKAFAYVMDIAEVVEISTIGSHINKVAYLISYESNPYSSYNASSGEESLINILVDIITTPEDALILIDEVEAGFHPSVQRKLADIIQYISWHHKKQFILTTHSPSFLAALPQKSRKFIDKNDQGNFETINAISVNAAFSKMDSKSYPLMNLYCEDTEAEFIIKNVLMTINQSKKNFDRLINIIRSGPANEVKDDYLRHKRNFSMMKLKPGYAAIFDGDYKNEANYSNYHNNPSEYTFFLYPYTAPEKFLVKAYLNANPNAALQVALTNIDHHSLFQEMVNLGLASDKAHGRQLCWDAFKDTAEYTTLETELTQFLFKAVTDFSIQSD
jgi:predicted ATPase